MNEDSWPEEPVLPIPAKLVEENPCLSTKLGHEESKISESKGAQVETNVLQNKVKKKKDIFNGHNEPVVGVLNKENNFHCKAKSISEDDSSSTISESYLKKTPLSKSTPLRKRSTRKRKSPTTLDDTAVIAKHSRNLRSQKPKYVSDAEDKVVASVGNNVTTKNRTWRRRSENSDLFDQDQNVPISKQPLLHANNTVGANSGTETNGHFKDESIITDEVIESNEDLSSEKSESSVEEILDNEPDKIYKNIRTVPNKNYRKRLRSSLSREKYLSCVTQVNENLNGSKPSGLDSTHVLQEKGVITFQDLLNIFKETQGQTQPDLNESFSKTAKSFKTSEAELYINKTENSTNEALKSSKIQDHSDDTKSSVVSNTPENLIRPASSDNKIENKNTKNCNLLAIESSNIAQRAEQNLNFFEHEASQTPEPSSDDFSGSDPEVKVYLQKYKNNKPKSYTKVLRSSAKKEKLFTATTNDNYSPKPAESSINSSSITQENKNENYKLKDSHILDTPSTDDKNSKPNVIEENNHPVIYENHTQPKIQSKDKHQKVSQKQLFSNQDGYCSSIDEFGDLVIDEDDFENEDDISRKGSSLKQADHFEDSKIKDAVCKDISEPEEEYKELSIKVLNSEENNLQPNLNKLSVDQSTTNFSDKSVLVKELDKTSILCVKKNAVVTTGFSTKASLNYVSKQKSSCFIPGDTKSKEEDKKNEVLLSLRVLKQNDKYEQPFSDYIMRGTPFVVENIIKPLSSLSLSYESWILKESRLKAISPLKKRKSSLLCNEKYSIKKKKSLQPLDFSNQKSYEISYLLNDGALSIFKKYVHPLKLKKLPNSLIKSYVNVNRSLKRRLNKEKSVATKRLSDLVSTKKFSCDSTKNTKKFEEKMNYTEFKNTNFHNNTSTMPSLFLNDCKHINESDLLKSKLNSLFSLNSVNSDLNLTEQQSAVAEDYKEDFLLDNNDLSMSFSGADGSSKNLFFKSTEKVIIDNQLDGYQHSSFMINNNSLSENFIKQNIFKRNSQILPVCASDKMGQDLTVSAGFMSNLHNNVDLNANSPLTGFGCKFMTKNNSKLINNFAKGTDIIEMEVSRCINDLIGKIEEENSLSSDKHNSKHSQQFQKILSIKKKKSDSFTTTKAKKEVQKVLLLKPNTIRKKTTAKKAKTPILLRHKLLDLKKRNSLVGIESPEEREIDSLLSPKMDYFKYSDKDVLSLESPIPSFDDFKKLRKIQKANRKLQKSKKNSEENYHQMQNNTVDNNCYENTYIFDPSASSSPSSFKKRQTIVLPTVNDENSLSDPSTKQPDISASHFEPFRNKS